MPPMIATLARSIGIKGGAIIALCIAGAVLFGLWRWEAAGHADTKEKLALADAELVLLRTDAELKETAAEERQADNEAVAEQEKDLVNAIKDTPDSAPDAVRVRLACERLRRAGYLDADLPAVCRPGSGTEASPAG